MYMYIQSTKTVYKHRCVIFMFFPKTKFFLRKKSTYTDEGKSTYNGVSSLHTVVHVDFFI